MDPPHADPPFMPGWGIEGPVAGRGPLHQVGGNSGSQEHDARSGTGEKEWRPDRLTADQAGEGATHTVTQAAQ